MATDAVVVGAGPNGLVAANMLADAGWDVVVCEEQDEPGGAVRSGEVTEPGFVHDRFSAFYPLAPASHYIRGLRLEDWGVEWRRSEAAVAHLHPDGRSALLSNELEETCESLERFASGDGEAWRELYAEWRRVGSHLIRALLTPVPPLRAGANLARELGPLGLAEFARNSLAPARRLAEERFRGEGGGWLLAGNALHADLTPDSAGGGLFGWVLCGLGQQVGFPAAAGGSGAITRALVRRLEARGGSLETGTAIERIDAAAGRRPAAVAADGRRFEATRAILADVGAPALYLRMLPEGSVPDRIRRAIRRFQYDNSTFKVNWSLDRPIPWTAPDARRAGTIHIAEGMDGLSRAADQLVRGVIPDRPFLVLGQYSMVDPSRSPLGTETAWAYTHIPQRIERDGAGEIDPAFADAEAEQFAERIENEVERVAPGFRKLIRRRHIQTPTDLEASNRNLVGGAINGGTAQVQQQLVLRPFPGLGRPETPVDRVYLASASAHPGGGLHGGPGGNAARAALARERMPAPARAWIRAAARR